jgi:DnaK suppressor protein
MRSLATAPSPTIDALDARTLVVFDGALRTELEAQHVILGDAEATLGALDGATDADTALAREMAERAMHHALDAIAEIEHALARISTGTYGRCEACGDAIPSARLEAIPSARTCVSCPPAAPLARR